MIGGVALLKFCAWLMVALLRACAVIANVLVVAAVTVAAAVATKIQTIREHRAASGG